MNTFGNRFKVTIFGESHGTLVGVVMDGVKPGLPLCESDFSNDIQRRKSGAVGTTPRKESDVPEIVSGVYEGHTTGAALTVLFKNENTKSSDYSQFRNIPRPGHSDYSASVKYHGYNDIRGGGQFSGRITIALVAAGVVAKKMLDGVAINARIVEVGGVDATSKECADAKIVEAMKEGDSVGGIIECVCNGVPAGCGRPFFGSVESAISHIVFSIPGVRGIEFGDGFGAAGMKGSQHNDPIVAADGKTGKNGAGGVNGGISNGNPIVFRVAVKPTSSISATQESFNFASGKVEKFSISGRHDTCIALRCPVIVEAAAAIALYNLMD